MIVKDLALRRLGINGDRLSFYGWSRPKIRSVIHHEIVSCTFIAQLVAGLTIAGEGKSFNLKGKPLDTAFWARKAIGWMTCTLDVYRREVFWKGCG
jgi:hypothetical protein